MRFFRGFNKPQSIDMITHDDLTKELDALKNKFNEQINSLFNEFGKIPKPTVPPDKLEGSITKKIVKRKLDGYKKELEFIELSTKIYVLDDGYKKLNPPYVISSNKGVTEGKPEPGAQKLRCYILKRLLIPGYYKEDDFMSDDNFKEFFGKTYREIVSHMAEHNYYHNKNEMYCLNFEEI